jgi:signal transduction histidine kinase
LAEGAKRLGLRQFGERLPVRSKDEIGQVAESFNTMAEALAKTTVSKAELEVLAGRLMTAQEDERRRIARELHDDVTQRMAAIAIQAGRLAQLPEGDGQEWKEGLREIQRQVARLSDDIHGLSRSLHPGVLDDLGLAAGIESECRAFFERGGAPVEVSIEAELEGLPKEVQLGIYRIVQEGLRNIQKHAKAENVRVKIEPRGTELCLTIRDDGRGFDRKDRNWRAGLGLASMEERARLLGGRMEIDSKPGAGTAIVVYWPVSREAV